MPYGRQKSGVKVHEESKIGASEIRGVRDQVGGSGVKIRASGFRSSKVPGVKGDESHCVYILQLKSNVCPGQILQVQISREGALKYKVDFPF